jgi:hypothetical protein
LTRGGRLATLDRSEGIAMGEIDERTAAGLTATLGRAFGQGEEAMVGSLYEPGAVEEARYGRRSGEQLLDSGTYLAVVRRRPARAWRWSIDRWNSDAG